MGYTNASHAHFRYYGEDKFMAWYMHYGGVLRIPSRQEAVRVPLTEPIKGLHITTSCPAHHIPQTGSKLVKADKKSGAAMKGWEPDCRNSSVQEAESFHEVLQRYDSSADAFFGKISV